MTHLTTRRQQPLSGVRQDGTSRRSLCTVTAAAGRGQKFRLNEPLSEEAPKRKLSCLRRTSGSPASPLRGCASRLRIQPPRRVRETRHSPPISCGIGPVRGSRRSTKGGTRIPDGTFNMWFGYMNRNYEEVHRIAGRAGQPVRAGRRRPWPADVFRHPPAQGHLPRHRARELRRDREADLVGDRARQDRERRRHAHLGLADRPRSARRAAATARTSIPTPRRS